ncbi:MAG: hypothetical protein V1900_01085 [Candidatus Aenigmatarchaeota archaeon]
MNKFWPPVLATALIMIVVFVSGCTQSTQSPQTKTCPNGAVINSNENCPTYWCGDKSCLPGSYNGYTENCTTCPSDCGECPSATTSRFNVAKVSCDDVLSQLKLTIKNIYNESVNVQEVSVNLVKDEVSTTKKQNPNKIFAPGEELSFIFPTLCNIDYFQIEVTYVDSKGTHKDYGNRYEIP